MKHVDIPLKNITHQQSRRVTNGQVYGQLRVWVLICLTALPSPLSALSSPSVSPLSLLSTHLALVVLEHHVGGTVARGREGVRNTSGITPKKQARGVAHLGLHHSRRMPQVGTSLIYVI